MEVNLVFVMKNGTTQAFPLPSAVTFIGRRQDCDMCIPLSVVSRRHCEVFTEFNSVHVRDLKSRNGTFVNDESIGETQLKAGDTLRIGPVTFVVQIDGVPESFDEYLPTPAEDEAGPAFDAPSQEETQEATIEEIIEEMPDATGGQSQTMDMDSVFKDDILDDDDFDLGSDLLDS